MVIIDSREAVEAYLNHDRIECLACGKRFEFLPIHIKRAHGMTAAEYREAYNLPSKTPLAGRAYRAMQREKMNRLIADGIVTHDHLNDLIENNKTKGRGEKREYDLKRQKEIAKNIPRKQLPAGAKRKNGRDADKAREYQREYRARKKQK